MSVPLLILAGVGLLVLLVTLLIENLELTWMSESGGQIVVGVLG